MLTYAGTRVDISLLSNTEPRYARCESGINVSNHGMGLAASIIEVGLDHLSPYCVLDTVSR
jgi:hypothetical protein